MHKIVLNSTTMKLNKNLNVEKERMTELCNEKDKKVMFSYVITRFKKRKEKKQTWNLYFLSNTHTFKNYD